MKTLIINSPTHGIFEVFYDDDMHSEISKYSWHIEKRRFNTYASTTVRMISGKRRNRSMHQLVMSLDVNDDKKPMIDHKDNNGLNNQKINLRIATHAQNQHNLSKRTANRSGYKGVCMYYTGLSKGKYVARICCNGKRHFIGVYKNVKDAAIAYNKRAIELHGEFAKLNEI